MRERATLAKQEEQAELVETIQQMDKTLHKLARRLHASDLADYVLLMNSPRKLFSRSIIAGIGRGVGIAIGFTVFLLTLLYFLRALGALNLPIIGDYIADVVEIVQNQLQMRNY